MARKAITKIVIRKTGYAVVKYGRVQFFHRDRDAIDTFLSGFDPDFAARRVWPYPNDRARAA